MLLTTAWTTEQRKRVDRNATLRILSWPVTKLQKALLWSRNMVLTRKQRLFVVKHYFHIESYALCQDAFQRAFPNDTAPNKTTIYRIIKSLKRLALCVIEIITAVAPSRMPTHCKTWGLACCRPLSKSLRKLSQQNMSFGSAHKAVTLLHLRVYRIHATHELRPTDHAAGLLL
jgi:hypothetical protein